VGLGAGAMISYSQPGQHWTLYEIDPAVVRIAQDTNFFTYLSACARAPYSIELGDARLKLQNAADGSFGVLFIDAFSSDVIPMHLLTVEAVKLYRQKLATNGILAFHLSSRHFELEPLVANVGDQLGLFCFSSTRGELTPQAIAEGGLESNWVILVNGFHLARIVQFATWQRIEPNPKGPLWTDNFSSLIGVLRPH
jgi:spermidine synthase